MRRGTAKRRIRIRKTGARTGWWTATGSAMRVSRSIAGPHEEQQGGTNEPESEHPEIQIARTGGAYRPPPAAMAACCDADRRTERRREDEAVAAGQPGLARRPHLPGRGAGYRWVCLL